MQYPSDSEFKVPEVDLWEFLFEERKRPCEDARVLFIDAISKRSLTFGEIKDTAQCFGQGLKEVLDWQCGDVIAIMSTNSLDVPLAMWGAHYAGGIVVLINPSLSTEDIAYQLCNSGAKLFCVIPEALENGKEAAALAALRPEQVFVLGNEDFDTQKTWKSLQRDYPSSDISKRRVLPSDVAYIVYTSGTTGPKGKGVMLTHANVTSNLLQREKFETILRPTDRGLSQIPWYTVNGTCAMLLFQFFMGMTNIVLEKFDFVEQLKAIEEYKVTYMWIIPPIATAMAHNPIVQKFDLSSVKSCFSFGSPCSWATMQAVYRSSNIRIRQAYGQTEAPGLSFGEPWNDEDWETGSGGSSVGKLLPYIEGKIVDPEGNQVPNGESGELMVRGPNVMAGYIGNPTATSETIDSDGYLKTGDLAYFDDQGRLYIRARMKELIFAPSGMIMPSELEEILVAHPAVADAAVASTKGSDGKSVAKAFVILKKSGLANKEDLMQLFTKENILPSMRLEGGVTFVEKIPRSPAGKVLRRVLATPPLAG